MDPAILDNQRQELRRGVLAIACLEVLEHRDYGLGVLSALRAVRLPADGNTIYPLLRRLETQGALTSEWDRSSARPRRYYSTTAAGLALRDDLRRTLDDLATSLVALRRAAA